MALLRIMWLSCLRSTHDRQIVVVFRRVLVTVEVELCLHRRSLHPRFGDGLHGVREPPCASRDRFTHWIDDRGRGEGNPCPISTTGCFSVFFWSDMS